MAKFIPQQTIEWKLEEPPAFRRFTLSIVEMAAITGVLLRIYRSVVLTHGSSNTLLYLGGTFLFGGLFLFGMAALHLGNFPLRHWLWRAPGFAVIEATVESLTSAVLIALHREPLGSGRAEWDDWFRMSVSTFIWNVGALLVFAILLSVVVQVVRYWLLKREHREHTAHAVHEEIERHTQEHSKPV